MSKDPEIRRVNQALKVCLKENDCFTCSHFKGSPTWGHCSRFYRFIQFYSPHPDSRDEPRNRHPKGDDHALPVPGSAAAPGL